MDQIWCLHCHEGKEVPYLFFIITFYINLFSNWQITLYMFYLYNIMFRGTVCCEMVKSRKLAHTFPLIIIVYVVYSKNFKNAMYHL
jgi:hypothetical protein